MTQQTETALPQAVQELELVKQLRMVASALRRLTPRDMQLYFARTGLNQWAEHVDKAADALEEHAQAPAPGVVAAATLALSALETGSTHDQRRTAFDALRDAVFPAPPSTGAATPSQEKQMEPQQDVIELPDRSPLRLRLAEAEALLGELRINANRMCDRRCDQHHGGTYEADCRHTLRKVDDYQKAACLADRGPQRAATPQEKP